MGFQDFISECEAASIAGVSRQTLSRFTEAGYLQVEVDGDGMRLFNKKELSDVFGLSAPTSPLESRVEKVATPSPQRASEPQCASETKLNFRPENENSTYITTSPVDASPIFRSTGSYYAEASQKEPSKEIFATSVSDKEQDLPPNAETIQPPPPLQEQVRTTPLLNNSAQSSHEVSRLTAVTSMLEKLLDIREAEIKDLKEQRDWLRGRVERLEEKGDRDQLLLLSETQVIRKLVAGQQDRKSPLRAALEWLGVIEPTDRPQTGTIEMRQETAPPQEQGPGPVVQ